MQSKLLNPWNTALAILVPPTRQSARPNRNEDMLSIDGSPTVLPSGQVSH